MKNKFKPYINNFGHIPHDLLYNLFSQCILFTCFLALLAALLWVIPVFLNNVDAGFDLTDHGYYLINLHQPENLLFNIAQFGHVWRSFFGENNIIDDRLIVIVLVIFSGILLCYTIYIRHFENRSLFQLAIWCFSGILVSLNALHWFFLTPHYNNMGFVLSNIIISLFFLINCALERKILTLRLGLIFFFVGFFYASLILSRIPSALILALVFSATMIFVFPKIFHFRNFLIVFFSFFLGMFAFGLLVTIRSASILDVLRSMWDGYFLLQTAGTHQVTFIWTWTLFYDFFLKSGSYILGEGLEFICQVLIGFAILALLFQFRGMEGGQRSLKKRAASRSGHASSINALLNFLLISFLALEINALATSTDLHKHLLAIYWLGTTLGLITFFIWWIYFSWSSQFFGVMVFLFSIPLIGSFGSANGFYYLVAFYAGFPALLLLLSGLVVPGRAQAHVVAMGVILVLSTAYSGVTLMQEQPYRLFGTLSEATVVSSVAGTDGMRLTPSTARVLNSAREYAFQGEPSLRPLIIDLSGQVPVMVEHLNGRSPPVPWIIAYMDRRYSEVVFGEIESAELARAWIIAGDWDRTGLETASPHFQNLMRRLQDEGLEFESDFVYVATFTVPVLNRNGVLDTTQVDLFKPK